MEAKTTKQRRVATILKNLSAKITPDLAPKKPGGSLDIAAYNALPEAMKAKAELTAISAGKAWLWDNGFVAAAMTLRF